MRLFGWNDRVDDTCAVATEFVHVGGLPLWPRSSHLIDTPSLATMRGRERRLLSTKYLEVTTFRSIPIPRDRRSVIAAYVRTWGTLAVVLGVSGSAISMLGAFGVWFACAIGVIGIAACVLGGLAQRLSFLRFGDQLALFGVGAVLGVFGSVVMLGMFGALLTRVASIALCVGGGVSVVLVHGWRRATAPRAAELGKRLGISRDVMEQRRTLMHRAAQAERQRAKTTAAHELPTAMARIAPKPAPPSFAPIEASAPERVEAATDVPRILGG